MKFLAVILAILLVNCCWADDLSKAREKQINYDLDEAQLLLTQEKASAEMTYELAWLYFDCLRPKKAVEAFTLAIKKAKAVRNELFLGRALLARARVFASLNERTKSRKDFEEGKKTVPYPRGPAEAALIGFVHAVLEFENERQMNGLAKAVQVAAIARAGDEKALEARCYLIMGERASYGQRKASLLRAVDLATQIGGGPLEARARLALSQLERQEKKYDKALERIVQSTERLKPGLADRLIQKLRYEEGLSRKELDRWAGAIRSFVLSRSAAERLGDTLAFAEVSIPLIVCCKARNIVARGKEYGREALASIAENENDVAIRLRKRINEAISGLDKPH